MTRQPRGDVKKKMVCSYCNKIFLRYNGEVLCESCWRINMLKHQPSIKKRKEICAKSQNTLRLLQSGIKIKW